MNTSIVLLIGSGVLTMGVGIYALANIKKWFGGDE